MPEAVAIIGMAAAFPGAPDLPTFWSNIARGVDAISEAPASRLDPEYFTDGGLSTRRGGFLAATFDPAAFGIMPVAAAAAEPDQLLALQVADRALADAGTAVPHDRTGVILGRGNYPTPGLTRLVNRVRVAEQVAMTLAELLPELGPETVRRVREAFRARSGNPGADAIGLVPNLAASRIANRLDLHGPAYTVDAACASSLVAIELGCRELAVRRCDLVLAGGVHVCHDITLWSVFHQLGALSASSVIRPFDRRADGILIGEGAGLVVLKRLADAERDGDRVYAVILGVGVSSDGRESSAMRPRAEAQVAAMAAAWHAAERDPATVGLVEAHGTGTPTGDAVELAALAQLFGAAKGPRAGLGSVKSMIGHAMPAAGAAGLIKAALALHHGVVPPSLHCDEPRDTLAATRFRVPPCAEDWGELPRRAGVSAFGFGGINAHVVLEAHGAPARRRARHGELTSPRVLAIAASSIDGLRAALDGDLGDGGRPRTAATASPGDLRFAMLHPTPERRALAHKVLDRGKPWRGQHDIWLSPHPLGADGGKLAFVFPGVEAAFAPNVEDVAHALGMSVPPAIAEAARAAPRSLEQRGSGVFELGRLLAAALTRLGVVPDVIAGHSIGEWTGMVASDMVPRVDVDAFFANLPGGALEVPDAVFVAVGCGAAGAQAALDGLDTIAVSHDNCPHQSIVCGRRDRIEVAVARLRQRGVLCQELPFRSGFHSPMFADFIAPHRRYFATLALQRPRVPLWSATTCAPYPEAPDEIRAIAIDHLVKPVRFRELVDRLYASGVRAFVQLGVGSLCGFIADTLRGRDHAAIAAASSRQDAKPDGLAQLARVRAALYVEHFTDTVAGDLARDLALELAPAAAPNPALISLELGAPLVKLAGAVPPLAPPSPIAHKIAPDGDPVLAELAATLEDIASASRAVVAARRAPRRPRSIVLGRTLSVDAEPALLDHCLFPQPRGWPTPSDGYPVVPMTMTIAMMIDAARQLAPDRVAIAVEDVRALRWIAVAPPVQVEITATARDPDRVDVDIRGYARATIQLADRYPAAPAPRLPPLRHPRPTPVTAQQLYTDRWMFHGARYSGVVGLGPVGSDGLDGEVLALPAPGALLDGAGQLVGWWVMQAEQRDRLALPVQIGRLALYGPEPATGTRARCRVRFHDVGQRRVRADLELVVNGQLWARIEHWEDRRFECDDRGWNMFTRPDTSTLAVSRPGGYVRVTEQFTDAASRELMMRRYLGAAERSAFDAVAPRDRRGWLLGRIAIKDAVRLHHWRRGGGPMFPVEVEVAGEREGRPAVNHDLRVSVACLESTAVAIVSDGHEGDHHVGIARIAPRGEDAPAIAITPAELALGAGQDPDEWRARLAASKQAVARSRPGALRDPGQLVVRDAAVHADRAHLMIDDDAVDTCRDGDYAVAWTRRSLS